MPVLQQQQLDALADPDNSEIEMTKGNVDSTYELPAHAQHLMHLELTKKVHDAEKKQYTTQVTYWSGPPAQYARMAANDSFAEYDSTRILHDVRPKATQKAPTAAKTAAITGTTDGEEPLTKADLQGRYKALSGKDAPEEMDSHALEVAIADLEKGQGTSKDAAKKAPRSLADHVARYEELAATAVGLPDNLRKAPADATIGQLKAAIADLEKGAAN